MKTSRFYHFLAVSLLTSISGIAQEKTEQDSTKTIALDEILVSAVRADKKTPVAFTNVNKKELSKRNLGQDIPTMMNYMPSVVTTTDAGNGVGYSGIRVRGSDATRVNVTLNGIPYNDSESHGTYWVNMPDFTSSVQDLQLQRGVGTSTNGSGAFGASLNLLTDSYSYESNGELSNSFGSFNTRKHTLKFSTGLINDKFEIAGRISNMYSDGYIDRATADMNSYFLQGTFLGKTTLVKALLFGGFQKTYLAWNGASKEDINKFGRKYNPSGKYTDDEGNIRFYENETDNYGQDHFQLHWNERISDNWSTNLAIHYTKGKGYDEFYVADGSLLDIGFNPINVGGVLVNNSDNIVQKWLDNDFYGFTFHTNYKNEKLDLIIGGAVNQYVGLHFGNIQWVKQPLKYNYGQEYYNEGSKKNDVNTYVKATYQLNSNWSLFGDMQYRNVLYKAEGPDIGNVNDDFNFLNPKAGITFIAGKEDQIYFSYGRANREPNRSDYNDNDIKPTHEKLNDFELGWRHDSNRTILNVNAFYMRYKNQLVLTGKINNVGVPIRQNSGDSYRLGVEVDATVRLMEQLYWRPSISISTNKNIDFYSESEGELKNLGNTNISYSPNVVASNIITYIPIKGLDISLLTKFVGEQYMDNLDNPEAKLDSYFVNDINVTYGFPVKGWLSSIELSLLANNIFNVEYISNGYAFGAYFPQAKFNFLAGLTLKF